MRKGRVRRWGLTLAVAMALGAGCAQMKAAAPAPESLPPARTLQSADLAGLAGEWEGMLTGAGLGAQSGGRANVRVTVAPDGAFTATVDGQPGLGKARIQDGNVVFEGSTTRGTATLYEGGGRRVLRGQGTFVGIDGESVFEVTKR